MNTALITTAGDLAAVLSHPLKEGRKLVMDDDTGEIVGWIRESAPGWWEWHAACQAWGEVRDKGIAVERIAEAIADSRREQDFIDREIAHLPIPLKALRIAIEDAKTRFEIERQRNVRREAEYNRRQEDLRQAELAYAAVERALAEAA